MRKIREVLRLRAEGFSEREIVRSVGCARSSVQICLWRADKARVLRRWRSRLKGNGKSGEAKSRATAKVATAFIDIGAIATDRSRFEVRLELGAGMILSIARS